VGAHSGLGWASSLPEAFSQCAPDGACGIHDDSGLAWGAYSLVAPRNDVTAQAAENFVAATILCLAIVPFALGDLKLDPIGSLYAVCSGALASGLAYALWYWIRGFLSRMAAGSLQLTVPILAAGMGATVLSEHLTAL